MTPPTALERWVDRVVIGLDLCPFARRVRDAGGVHIDSCPAKDPADAVAGTLVAAQALLDTPAAERATTLVAFGHGLADFGGFLDVVETVEALLAEAGADGLIQLAHFHPDYLFEGLAPDDPANWTNRAPVPVIQLLRVAQVSEAVDAHPDPAGIPARNMALLRQMGAAEWSRVFGS